jgi:Tol biopolymer transport system component
MLLDRPYRGINWGLAWSPDGAWIAFKGSLPNGSPEIAAVSVEGEEKGFKVILPSSAIPEINNCNCTMTWGGTGNQIIISMQTENDRQWQFHVFDFTGEKPPELLTGFPTHWRSLDPAWSCDGKKIAFSAVPAENPKKSEAVE